MICSITCWTFWVSGATAVGVCSIFLLGECPWGWGAWWRLAGFAVWETACRSIAGLRVGVGSPVGRRRGPRGQDGSRSRPWRGWFHRGTSGNLEEREDAVLGKWVGHSGGMVLQDSQCSGPLHGQVLWQASGAAAQGAGAKADTPRQASGLCVLDVFRLMLSTVGCFQNPLMAQHLWPPSAYAPPFLREFSSFSSAHPKDHITLQGCPI